MRIFFIIFCVILIISCNTENRNNSNATEDKLDKIKEDTTSYSEYSISTIYYTDKEGNVKTDSIKATFYYNDKEVKVNFKDSTWFFEVKNIEKKVEGTTIYIKDKKFRKYKEIFISAGDLNIITFTTETRTGNLTLM